MLPLAAASLALRKRAAPQTWAPTKALGTYIREAWHVTEPATPYRSNWHIDVIAESTSSAGCAASRPSTEREDTDMTEKNKDESSRGEKRLEQLEQLEQLEKLRRIREIREIREIRKSRARKMGRRPQGGKPL
jgi:hypothetical protein